MEIQARRDVYVRIVPPEHAKVDFVQLSFKDQYIGRSDILALKFHLSN